MLSFDIILVSIHLSVHYGGLFFFQINLRFSSIRENLSTIYFIANASDYVYLKVLTKITWKTRILRFLKIMESDLLNVGGNVINHKIWERTKWAFKKGCSPFFCTNLKTTYFVSNFHDLNFPANYWDQDPFVCIQV